MASFLRVASGHIFKVSPEAGRLHTDLSIHLSSSDASGHGLHRGNTRAADVARLRDSRGDEVLVKRVLLLVGGIAVLGTGWYLGSPLFIRTYADEAVPQAAPAAAPAANPLAGTAAPSTQVSQRVLASGQLQYVDSAHNGKGEVRLIEVGTQRLLRFQEVAITNAPDVYIYLSRETGGKWSDSSSLLIGPAKATNGSFNYDVPAGVDLTAFRSVVVWCRAFSVLITWADLARTG